MAWYTLNPVEPNSQYAPLKAEGLLAAKVVHRSGHEFNFEYTDESPAQLPHISMSAMTDKLLKWLPISQLVLGKSARASGQELGSGV